MPEGATPRQVLLDFPGQPQFTFDTFIETPSSRFAVATCLALSTDPNIPYQTVYLSGDPGLGKTHLLLAMGNEAAKNRITAFYVSCRRWAEELQQGQLDEAADWTCRLSQTGLLLMDDVDHLAGLPRAQETVYEAYNRLREQGARLAFSGRMPPQSLPDTERFLTSRFQWGVTAELGPLDDAALGLVVAKLGRDVGLEIPEPVVQFLMLRLRRDYPALKEAVEQLNRESLRQKKKVTVPLAKTALQL